MLKATIFFLGLTIAMPVMAANMSAADKLLAIEEIHQLKARYFRCVDTKDWACYQAVFAPDIAFKEESGNIRRGPEGKMQMIKESGLYDQMVSVHHGFNPEIEILTPTTAKGIWAMEYIVSYPAGRVPKSNTEVLKPGQSVHEYGYYYETYSKINGHWLIQSQEMKKIRSELSGIAFK